MIIKTTRSKPAKKLDGSGEDQDDLQCSGATLICCEKSNRGKMEGEYKVIQGLRAF